MKSFLLLGLGAIALTLALGLHADACHKHKGGGRRGAGCSGQAASYGCSSSAVIAAPAPIYTAPQAGCNQSAGYSQSATACAGSAQGCSGGRRLLFWRR